MGQFIKQVKYNIRAAFFMGMVCVGTGCFGNMPITITPGVIPKGSTPYLDLIGTLAGQGGQWTGNGSVCYHLDCLASRDRNGCVDFSTDAPGHFKVMKPISHDDLSSAFCFGEQIWLNLGGQKIPGTIGSSVAERQTSTINGVVNQSIYAVSLEVTFDMPANLVSQPALPVNPGDAMSSALSSLGGRGEGVNGNPQEATASSDRETSVARVPNGRDSAASGAR